MKNKGFTLAEMVAVIAILMFLAALSVPFVRGYIDDAYNGKALNHMRELYEASRNFEKDYPGTTVSDDGSDVIGCDIDAIYGASDLIVKPSVLENCHYIKPTSADLTNRYTFTLGSGAACSAVADCSGSGVAMTGGEKAGIYNGKCACVTSLGRVCKQNSDNSTNCL